MASVPGRGNPVHQRLIADDGTVVRAEHRPPTSGKRSAAIVIVHGFMLHSSHPYMRRVAGWLDGGADMADVVRTAPAVDDPSEPVVDPGLILLDMRGHGRSNGVSTLGWYEVLDVAAAVQWARALGYAKVVTLGFSLGAAVVLRHAALIGGVDRVAAVSGPGQWFFRGTARMRFMHHLVLTAPGRFAVRTLRRTRITSQDWPDPLPIDPTAAARMATVPVLVVHGDMDDLFPTWHAERIADAAANGEVWLVPGFGHAEAALDPELAGRLREWLVT
ncbi:MAG TPA: alpha/beta fold hydrolase [Jiangellaceae bacterium]